jgi:hypothetical protein
MILSLTTPLSFQREVVFVERCILSMLFVVGTCWWRKYPELRLGGVVSDHAVHGDDVAEHSNGSNVVSVV